MPCNKIISGAAVLLALAPSALAVGSASIYNNCGFSVYYASIQGEAEGLTEMSPGGQMTESYSGQNDGVSVKMATTNTLAGPISQFEFTWSSPSIFYDLSNINGDGDSSSYPFSVGGITIEPSVSADSAFPTCTTVNCPAGEVVCSAAYNAPDDPRTLVCSEDTSLALTLCPGGSSSPQGNGTTWTSSKRDMHIHSNVHAKQIRHPHGKVWVSM